MQELGQPDEAGGGFLKGLLTCIPICGKAIVVQPQNNSCHTQTCLAHATNDVIRNSGSSQSPRDSYSTGFANIRHFWLLGLGLLE